MQKRESKLVIGLMSGTSVDGVDATLVKINPDFSFEEINSIIYDFTDEMTDKIHSLFKEFLVARDLCSLNFVIAEYFAKAVLELCRQSNIDPKDVDLIGSHGQTIYHFPTSHTFEGIPLRSTLQIGDISVLAGRTGIKTIGDFRTADVAAGGQGAPLVCFADEVIFKKGSISRAIQNIGGISNVTVVSPNCDTFAFDTGPGNVLINYFTNKFFALPYDEDGLIAKSGKIDEEWLAYLLNTPYLKEPPPKTTGRELFNQNFVNEILANSQSYKPEDMIATITAFTAKSIADAYRNFVFPKTKIDEIVLGGGGTYNKTLVNLLDKEFDYKIPIKTHEDFGVSTKFKEAIAFAMLAYACEYDIPNNVPSCTGATRPVVMGKIAKP